MKVNNHSTRPKGDVSPESPDFTTPEENIGSYFLKNKEPTGPSGPRKMNH